MSEKKKTIDKALVPLSEMLSNLLPYAGELNDGNGSMIIESLNIDMPIELEVLCDNNGDVTLGSSPPLYHLETSFGPVLHQVTLTIQQDDDRQVTHE